MRSRNLVLSLVVASLAGFAAIGSAQTAAPSTAVNPKIPRLSDVQGTKAPAWLAGLVKGGYVVFFRHGATDWNQRDTDYSNFDNRDGQRNLSDVGKAEAASIGKAFQDLGIPHDSVFVSPMFRCRDTADLAFGHGEVRMALFGKVPQSPGTMTESAAKRAAYRAERIGMLSDRPAAGQNTILVGQQDPMIPVIPGLHRDELRESDALVIKPLGKGQFKILALVTVADWARLASEAKAH
jgi:phosphohistidine phosphatase SixA